MIPCLIASFLTPIGAPFEPATLMAPSNVQRRIVVNAVDVAKASLTFALVQCR